uniref:Uncharacterized protein n=1 Tax=Candidatus Kentrum sp. LPFa TaxID=2126335 RepID=A0A450Y0D7_9GAMM|nr:MAG: hypothetical protein BECKLPF1236A_GA0070988_102884 [Candidatus Kentron sp. LPFa]VFK34996.1 MAG: hypothetical protein BECKLPF1236C_GA0070990_103203 [Candidatus Kentron sp. LPFa]
MKKIILILSSMIISASVFAQMEPYQMLNAGEDRKSAWVLNTNSGQVKKCFYPSSGAGFVLTCTAWSEQNDSNTSK